MTLRRIRLGLWLLLCVITPIAARPVPLATLAVTELVSPAWLERAGQRLPLAPGDPLSEGDRVQTGPGGRLRLDSSVGDRLELGESADLVVERFGPESAGPTPPPVRIRLQAGALHYEAPQVGAWRRRVGFLLGAIDARVDGTRFWARAGGGRDLLCLIQGLVEVLAGKDERIYLSDPRSVYGRSPRGQAVPVTRASPTQLAAWLAQTSRPTGAGLMRADGPWRVHLASTGSRERAEQLRLRIRRAGFPVELQHRQVDGQVWWRLLLPGLATEQDALEAGERLQTLVGAGRPWVSRR